MVSARADETLIEVGRREGVEIPHLCYSAGPAGGGQLPRLRGRDRRRARARAVVLPHADAGHEGAHRQRARARAQRLVLELLQADMPEAAFTRNNELDRGPRSSRWASRVSRRERSRRPTCRTRRSRCNLDACIQCTRCLRACRDEQVNDVIGLAFRGEHAKIVFDMDDAMGDVHLRGAAANVCRPAPPGALMPARRRGASRARPRGRIRCARIAASAAS